jgi:hypothetical protein
MRDWSVPAPGWPTPGTLQFPIPPRRPPGCRGSRFGSERLLSGSQAHNEEAQGIEPWASLNGTGSGQTSRDGRVPEGI